ncbi:nuclear transport factor 2 family protein [Ornithinibacillus xuwenensis]|uniref:Nuclear transport factor 2 family protein n=1 Tax=Ornithinibacillus xuwenensis TaxID=3144668 RepID=A0ABU9XJJ9_9BACI
MNPNQQNNTMSKKEIAVTFLQLVATGKVQEAYSRFVAPNFSHHNPYFRGDADSLMKAMEENAADNPNKVFEVKRAIEENDHVAVHSHVKQNREDLGAVVIHIFRFQENQIIELWDVGQPLPVDSPNENGIF